MDYDCLCFFFIFAWHCSFSKNKSNAKTITIDTDDGDDENSAIIVDVIDPLIEITDECRMEKTPLGQTGEFTYSFVDDYYNIRTYEEDNPVDACYEMIIKLHELDAL